jgi:ribosome-associated translation inhibitor RaiA
MSLILRYYRSINHDSSSFTAICHGLSWHRPQLFRRLVVKVIVESRTPKAADLRPLVEQRVRFVLKRLTHFVPRARVQLSDVNGPRGGIDKRCQIEIQTEGAGTVVTSVTAREWLGALNSALSRASSQVLKNLKRQRAYDHGSRQVQFQE